MSRAVMHRLLSARPFVVLSSYPYPLQQRSLFTSLRMAAQSTQSPQQGRQGFLGNSPFALVTETGVKDRPEIPQGHFSIEMASRMAHIHNLLLRALNASYNHCLSVPPGVQEAQDFLIFNQCFYMNMQSHHDMEELSLFPAIDKAAETPGAMDINVQEHKDFDDQLQRFRTYVFETYPKDYNGETMQKLIADLGPLLVKHLHNEINTLLDLHGVESDALRQAFNTGKEYFSNEHSQSMFLSIPFALTCADSTATIDGEITPPWMGNFATRLAELTLGWRYAGVWQFAPCDFYGNPRPLPSNATAKI